MRLLQPGEQMLTPAVTRRKVLDVDTELPWRPRHGPRVPDPFCALGSRRPANQPRKGIHRHLPHGGQSTWPGLHARAPGAIFPRGGESTEPGLGRPTGSELTGKDAEISMIDPMGKKGQVIIYAASPGGLGSVVYEARVFHLECGRRHGKAAMAEESYRDLEGKPVGLNLPHSAR